MPKVDIKHGTCTFSPAKYRKSDIITVYMYIAHGKNKCHQVLKWVRAGVEEVGTSRMVSMVYPVDSLTHL